MTTKDSVTTTHTAIGGTSIRLPLEAGDWKFQVMGWDGTTPFSGATYCGSTTQTLSGASATVTINVNSANCSGLKSLKLYTCSDLVGNDLSPITSASASSVYTTNWCDNNVSLTASQKQTARGMKVSIPGIASSIESSCLPTSMDPLTVGMLPLSNIPLTVKLYDLADCSIESRRYDFPSGISSAVNSDVILNTNDSINNSLFLKFQYVSAFPLTVTINQSTSQVDPASQLPVTFEAVFSQPINPATFSNSDIVQSGTASSVTWSIANSGDNRTFFVTATSALVRGTLQPTIPVNSVTDTYGLTNEASTSVDSSVTYNLPLTVTVNQATSQADPTNSFGVYYDVVFSHAVTPGSFTVSDVINLGTAAGVTWSLSTSDNITFSLFAVTASGGGTIIPSIPALVVMDSWGVSNLASTSTDNEVTFAFPVNVTLNQAAGQADPTTISTINFDVNFSGNILSSSFVTSDIQQLGTAAISSWTITQNTSSSFTLTANVSGPGTVIPVIPAGNVLDFYGFPVTASASTDNSVTYKYLIMLNPSVKNFGTVVVGLPSHGQKLALLNNTGTPLTSCSAPVLTDAANFDIYENTCASSLSNGSTCEITLRGKPQSIGMALSGFVMECAEAFVKTSDNGLSVQGISGFDAVSPSPELGLVNVGSSSAAIPVHFRAKGPVALSGCTTVSQSNGAQFQMDGTGCASTTIPASSACTMYIKGTPSAAGTHSTVISRTCGGVNASVTITMTAKSTTPTTMSAGGNVTCMKHSDDTARCWGFGNWGQLTNSGRESKFSPYPLNLMGIYSVEVGARHICAILMDSSVKCWGTASFGEIGTGVASVSQQVTPQPVSITGVTQLALSEQFTCALINDGSVKCWGYNYEGVFGNGTTMDSTAPVNGPVGPFTQISANKNSVCGLMSDQTIKCWGNNSTGQLGTNDVVNYTTPMSVFGISNATQLASGDGFHCALLGDSSVKCWGAGTLGQLGTGTLGNYATPQTVQGVTGMAGLAKGGGGKANHMCAYSSSTVKCWGQNYLNQTGINNTSIGQVLSATDVLGVNNIVSVVRGTNHTCALKTDGKSMCWGDNKDGQLGFGFNLDFLPRQVTHTNLILPIAQVAIGDKVTCTRTTSGQVQCWGANFDGQLGVNDYFDRSTPATVGVSSVTQLYANGDFNAFSVCTNSGGGVKCWGSNGGVLGNGLMASLSTPTSISSFTGALAIRGGPYHRCAHFSDGSAKCTGANSYGQLGNGNTSTVYSPVTASVLSGEILTSITGGFGNTYATNSAGTIFSFGYGSSGALGDNSTSQTFNPVVVQGITSASQVVGAYTAACAAHDGGKVSCWGDGPLGQPSAGQQNLPVRVSSLDTVGKIASGQRHACALQGDKVWCWGGMSGYGDLGNGSNQMNLLPQEVLNLSGVQSLWEGDGASKHSCAVRTDGTLWCWGNPYTYYPMINNPNYVSGYAP